MSPYFLLKSFQKNISEMSSELGKKVSLSIEGSDHLIDSKIAQDLKGALVHIVRNSLDHGIESPDERLKKGKSESGKLLMTCDRESNKNEKY